MFAMGYYPNKAYILWWTSHSMAARSPYKETAAKLVSSFDPSTIRNSNQSNRWSEIDHGYRNQSELREHRRLTK